MFQSVQFQFTIGIIASILLLLMPFQMVIPIELSVLETLLS